MKLLGSKVERLHDQLPAGALLENFKHQASIPSRTGDQLVAISDPGTVLLPLNPNPLPPPPRGVARHRRYIMSIMSTYSKQLYLLNKVKLMTLCVSCHFLFHSFICQEKNKQPKTKKLKYSTSFCSTFQTESLWSHSPLKLSLKKTFFPPITVKKPNYKRQNL